MNSPNHEFLISHRYLHFPIKNGNPKTVMQIRLAGQTVREFDLELAVDETPDWWAFYDVSQFQGKTVTLCAIKSDLPMHQLAQIFSSITQNDEPVTAADLYHEKYRPQFHFTPRRGWNNDPNGLVYHQGEYHLFFQHNPFGIRWGNMHWGHAVSRDLLHWQELPVALYPHSLADMAYSGGAVVDRHNTLDIEAGPEDPIVASFTSTGRGECLAFSLDRGRTFTDFPGNPVLRHTGRDPKVIWYEPSQKWVLIVYEELADQRGYALYDSHDLQRWTRLGFLPGFYECPELFELAVDGDPERKKWIIYGSTWQQYLSAYLIGDFDGATFTPAGEPLSAHCGPHFYAAQTFSHVPDGRVIMLGWLRLGWQPGDEFPGMPFGHGMTIPLELSLCSTPQGLRLCFLPVQELQNLHTGTIAAQNLTIPQANRLLAEVRDELLDIQVTIQPHSPQPFQIDLRGHPVLYHPAQNEISFAGKTASLLPILNSFELRLLVDRSVTEVFADQGYAAFSAMTIFPEDSLPITLQGDVTIQSLTIHPLRSIWHDEGS